MLGQTAPVPALDTRRKWDQVELLIDVDQGIQVEFLFDLIVDWKASFSLLG